MTPIDRKQAQRPLPACLFFTAVCPAAQWKIRRLVSVRINNYISCIESSSILQLEDFSFICNQRHDLWCGGNGGQDVHTTFKHSLSLLSLKECVWSPSLRCIWEKGCSLNTQPIGQYSKSCIALFLIVMLVRLILLWLIIYSHVELCPRVIWSVEFPRTSYWAVPQWSYCHIYLNFDLRYSLFDALKDSYPTFHLTFL